MKILGIETSCDETAAAVVEDGVRVLSNVIFSQVPLHRVTGGVVPEVAAREHVLKIMPVIEEAARLGEKANLFADIDAIAVTQGPGLLSSLVIGTTAASTLAAVWGKPLIGVNHIAGHIYANWLNRDENHVKFPCVVLTASGGHNELVLMKNHFQFELLGETLDDAAGEAFDKVARMLGMAYPGGPEIAREAEKGDAKKYIFPKAYMGAESFDFSFSGLKTAMLQFINKARDAKGSLNKKLIADCSASFQEAVCGVLSDKLLRAAMLHNAKTIIISGGVSANLRLRSMIAEKLEGGFFYDHRGRRVDLKSRPIFDFPADRAFCTDNAAMIAGAAFFKVQNEGGLRGFSSATSLRSVDPNLSLF